ncbi:lysophospholipid acyltransferase family protein [Paraliobacillus sp. JSM ZJ581]|uniref:lysophospholipid acyltransferase family protein n=1 Tax=Paraliobacillus sp. JSM ZJ581 TaxID=3342118 RepID=UPI0035A93933
MKTIGIYLYAGLLVLKSFPNLIKVRRIPDHIPFSEKGKRIFKTPKEVSQKVFKRTKSTIDVRGTNKLPEGPVLFVSNHQGLFDIIVLLGYVDKPMGFISKQEIKKIPIISSWMKELKCVFIDRSNRRAAIKVIDDGIESLKAGQSMVIFPEGTRTRGKAVQSFKSGSLRLATRANVPIVPIAIDGTYKIFEENDMKVKGGHVSLTICDPMMPDQYKEMKNHTIAEQLQQTIESVIANPINKVS